jgi:hypothetical protein
LSRAVVEKEHRGIADPDQAYILGELIRYLEHPRSGALEFEDMGASWVSVRNAVADGTLRQNNPEAADVAGRFSAASLRRLAARHTPRYGCDRRPQPEGPNRPEFAHLIPGDKPGRARPFRGALRIPNICRSSRHHGRPTRKIGGL